MKVRSPVKGEPKQDLVRSYLVCVSCTNAEDAVKKDNLKNSRKTKKQRERESESPKPQNLTKTTTKNKRSKRQGSIPYPAAQLAGQFVCFCHDPDDEEERDA
mmetsp:Transcript_6184/g.12568  ORF Transcript_6184/g.12568 Transcript_6184/m.12568 type:complete len:102 (+) Transcript_6184:716-1021(+)